MTAAPYSSETPFNGKISQLKASHPLIQDFIPGLKKVTANEYCCPCPECGGDDRFRVKADRQTYWCRQCNAKGDILSYITLTTGKSVKEQLAEAGLLDKPEGKTGRGSKQQFIWKQSKPGDSPAYTYLSATRGIASLQHSPAIRWNSFKPKNGGERVNRITLRLSKPGDNPDDPKSLHYLFLDTSATPPRKTDIQTNNAEEGAMKGRAVWFYPDKDTKTVAVAEGAETTLSALSVLGLNGAAALTTSGLKGIVLPQDTKELLIFCDQDTAEKGCAGQNAALELAERFEKGGGTAWIVSPSDQCFAEKPEKLDFNDLLMKDTSGELIRERFEKKQRLDEIDWRPKGNDKKKLNVIWSLANVEKLLEQDQEKLKELTTVQKHELAEEILLHNSFRSAELNAVRDMLKKQLGIAKSEQDKVLHEKSLVISDSKIEFDDKRTHAELASDFIKRFYPDRKQQIGAEGELWKYNSEKGIFEEIKLNKVEFSIGTAFRGDYCKRGSDYKSIARLIYNHLEQPIFFSEAPYGIPTRSCFIRLADDGSIRKEPYTPEHRVRYTLNVDAAEPGTRAPLFSRYLEDSFKGSGMEEQIFLLQEIMGAILTGCFSRQQKAVLLYGDGENGKSVLLELLDNMFLQKMKAAIPPEQFDNPYYLAMLAGKFVNIVGEVDKSKPLTATFKDVVGCDTPITARLPYKEPFEFKPRAAHIFSANNFPQSNDHSHGFYRRWIILSFRNVVHPDRKIQNLGATIASEEMPQVMAWALQGAERLAKNRHVLTSTSAHEECLNEWKNAKDSVFSFFHDEDEVELTHESSREPHKKVYEAYTSWCHDNGFKSTGYQEFLKRSGRFIKCNVRFPGEQRSFAGLRLLG